MPQPHSGMSADDLQYVTDKDGNRTHVILPIARYRELEEATASIDEQVQVAPYRPSHIVGLDPVTDSIAVRDEDPRWTYEQPQKGTSATAVLCFPFVVVLEGSFAGHVVTSLQTKYKLLREWLEQQGVIEARSYGDRFMQNYAFANVSEAVSVTSGGSKSGYETWRDPDGRTLKDLGYGKDRKPPPFYRGE